MTVILILVGVGYCVGFVFAFRRIAGQYAWYRCANPAWMKDRGREWPGGEQWTAAMLIAFPLSLVWPFALPVAYGLAGATDGGRFFYAPPSVRERLLRDRITELERQAGVR